MGEPIGKVIRLVPGLVERTNPAQEPQRPQASQPAGKADGNFADLFSNLINSVDDLQKESARLQEAFLSGEPVELHQVMIKAEEAGLAMELLLEIRNRIVNAYNELLRMPI
jgi:flagellar hook-basal body complex protein FliE